MCLYHIPGTYIKNNPNHSKSIDAVSLDQHKGKNEINNSNRSGAKIKKILDLCLKVFLIETKETKIKWMHNELLKYAKCGNIEEEDILGLSTIQIWLHSYA
ncbi:30827_t:CDS:2, partial [Gigaspora margarita]